MDKFLNDVEKELNRAETLHPRLNTLHEAYAVLLEESDELWEEVRKHAPDRSLVYGELVQIAAVAMRTAKDLLLPVHTPVEKASEPKAAVPAETPVSFEHYSAILTRLAELEEITTCQRREVLSLTDTCTRMRACLVTAIADAKARGTHRTNERKRLLEWCNVVGLGSAVLE